MSQTTVEKLNKRVQELEKDIAEIKSALIRDPEGDYRADFVKKMIKREQENPVNEFKDRESFLADVLNA